MHAPLAIAVRPAEPADATAVGRVHAEAWAACLAPILPRAAAACEACADRRREMETLARSPGAGQRLFVAVRGEVTVGFVWFGRSPADLPPYRARIHALYVAPGAQRAGVGGRLLGAAAEALAGAGLDAMMLWVLKANLPARRLYERWGGKLLASERAFRLGDFTYPSYPLAAYGWDRLPALFRGTVEGAAMHPQHDLGAA